MSDTTLTDGQEWDDSETGATWTVNGSSILYFDGDLGGTTKVSQL